MTRRILVVEDDHDIANLLKINLNDLCREISIVHNGEQALQQLAAQSYSLIILDLMLPGMDGLDVCQRLRGRQNFTPILMLTAKSAEHDRVAGLETGADDYLTKPFGIKELRARVKAILRRAQEFSAGTAASHRGLMRIGDLHIDVERRQVRLRERFIELTAKEFDLLCHFAQHPGRVFTRVQLLDSVWGIGHDGYEHTVNSHINRLRSKIEANPAAPRYILTVWGVGYKFSDAEKNRDD